MTVMPDPRLPPFSKEQLEDYIERVEGGVQLMNKKFSPCGASWGLEGQYHVEGCDCVPPVTIPFCGTSNSTFRYSAENPPSSPTSPRGRGWPYDYESKEFPGVLGGIVDMSFEPGVYDGIERAPDGTPKYDSERFRREKDIEYRASKLPGEHRDLSPTEGKRLCPAREEEWQECQRDWYGYIRWGMCLYCGGKMESTYFNEYDD